MKNPYILFAILFFGTFNIAFSAETRVSRDINGVEFTFTKVNHPKAGEGWRAPNGLIWYEQSPVPMPHKNCGYRELAAEGYCQKLGLRLPTYEEFAQLANYMGSTCGDSCRNGSDNLSYQPQVLPNLGEHWFWSEAYPDSNLAIVFNGAYGYIDFFNRCDYYNFVRCVGR